MHALYYNKKATKNNTIVQYHIMLNNKLTSQIQLISKLSYGYGTV